MKKTITLFLICCAYLMLFIAPSNCFGQSQIVGQSYITTVRLTVSALNDTSKKNKYDVLPGIKFTVIDITDKNQYVIQFGNFKLSDTDAIISTRNLKKGLRIIKHIFTDSTNNNGNNVTLDTLTKTSIDYYDTTLAFIGKWANYRKFILLPKDLDQKCALYYTKKWDFSYGALTLPLKVRFGNKKQTFSSYEENLNLGLTAGAKIRLPSTKNQVLNFLVLVGVASVNLDSLSVTDKSLYNSSNPTAKAVTFGLGCVYQFDAFQIGLFSGVDHISGVLGRAWRQQDRPWLGIGIGLALFNNSNGKSGSSPSNDGK